MLTVKLSSSTSQLRSASRRRACPVDDLSSQSEARRLMPAILPIKVRQDIVIPARILRWQCNYILNNISSLAILFYEPYSKLNLSYE